jgi:hypothetical protein
MAVTDYIVDLYYPTERGNLPPIDQRCQEKNDILEKGVHLLTIGGKLSVSIGPESWESPPTGDCWRGS